MASNHPFVFHPARWHLITFCESLTVFNLSWQNEAHPLIIAGNGSCEPVFPASSLDAEVQISGCDVGHSLEGRWQRGCVVVSGITQAVTSCCEEWLRGRQPHVSEMVSGVTLMIAVGPRVNGITSVLVFAAASVSDVKATLCVFLGVKTRENAFIQRPWGAPE